MSADTINAPARAPRRWRAPCRSARSAGGDAGRSRLAVVLSGSSLFSGGAGSGPSDIRKWIIENDGLEAIAGLPDQLFYNTGINTYVWIITNWKTPIRRGKVQLIDATGMAEKMRPSLGNKRNVIPENTIAEITRLFGAMAEIDFSKVLITRTSATGASQLSALYASASPLPWSAWPPWPRSRQ
ncbi:HsdM family class I SAM-dependent methyltransferase [Falsiroseomonas sp. E2-1-a20]|uniref:HsdM family class I SAM-dependent methyltransferase n=1 Tax=Falsiroseomonas sp. E2-1-a20 TaxID=3239300 RepID=UPI003F4182B9